MFVFHEKSESSREDAVERIQAKYAHSPKTSTHRAILEKFCLGMVEQFEIDGFTDRLVFSNQATSHLSGQVNHHNVRI